MTILNYTIIIISSLILSGCYTFQTDKNGEDQNELHLLWEYSYDLDGGAPRVKPLIYEDMIITSGDIKVTALDYQTGRLIWKTPFEHHRQLMNRTFGISGNIVVGAITRQVFGWNVYSGEQLWNISIHDSLSWSLSRGITEVHDHFLIPSQGNHHYFISSNGELNIEEFDARSYEISITENILYAGQRKDDKGVLSAYNAQTLDRKWRFEPGNFGFFSRVAPIIEGGVVYAGSTGGPSGSKNGFFALDAQTGDELWRREGIFTYSAVLVEDYLYIHDASGVYKLNKSDGSIEWYSDFNAGNGTAPIDYGYGYIYAPHSGAMHVVDAETGEIVHRFSPPDGSFFWRVTAGEGRIFAQSSRHLYAFAPWGHEEALE